MGRAPCCDKILLKKGPWTPEEDQKLIDYIQKNGCGNWRTLPKNAGLQRCGKSCRLRWTNYLRPDIKRGRFSFEEEETIIQLHSILGNKWSAIAARLPGRTDNEIKNYWNTHIRKRLLRMGIDPVTHSPRLDLLDLSTILNSSLYNHHPHSQMNFSRLLGSQPFINPELLRLATSLFSSQRQNPDNYLMQNQIINNDNNAPFCNQMVQPGQIQNPVQDLTAPVTLDQFLQYDDVQQIPFGGFSEVNDWQQCNGSDYLPVADCGFYGSGQPVLDPNASSETSTYNQSTSGNNFSFQSVLSNISTPSSSTTPLHSNSTYADQDERDHQSHCSSMLKFEIPDIIDVNDFM